jgi:predicted transposase/invertase (TIGR01784 family)
MDAAIQKAEEKMVYISSDKEALHAYQMREMALSDWTSGINHAKLEEKQEIARNMKANHESMDKIIRYTGLTEDQLSAL